MHCTSSFPGYYFARDLTPGTIAIPWPQLNSDITWRSGTGYNVPLQQPSIDHYMGYDKEALGQTMLNQEATFRYQVHELHRLYRRQRELMNELKRRYIQLQTSQSDPITSAIQSDISQKTFHVPGWPVTKATGSDMSLLGAEKFQGPLVAVHSQQADANPYPKKNGPKEVKLLSTKTTKFGKRILDLELPGDQYIDSEEEENILDENVAEVPQIQCHPPKESSKFLLESDSKLCSFSSGGSPNSYPSYGRNNCLIDLNEPVQLDESEVPIFSSQVESVTCCGETNYLDQHLSQKSNKESEVSYGEGAHTIQAGQDIDASSKISDLQDSQMELLPQNCVAGLDGAMLDSLMQVSLTGMSPLSCAERTSLGSNYLAKGHDLLVEVETKIFGSCISSSHQLVPQSVEPKIKALSLVSSQRKTVHDLRKIPIAVEALPCFDTPKLSVFGSSKINHDRFHVKKSARNPSFGNVSSYPTFISDGSPTSQQDSPAQSFKNTDHIKSSENTDLHFMPPRCSSETATPKENDGNADGENEIENSVNSLGWARKSCFDGEAPGSPDPTKSCNYDDQFPAFTPVSSKSDPLEVKDIENGEKDGKIVSRLAYDPITMSVKWSKGVPALGTGIGSNFSRLNAYIDLNSCIKEDGLSPALSQSGPHIVIGTTREIDLEAPVSPENKECSPPRGESEDMHLETPLQLVKEDEHPIGELDKVAAEAIISISSSGVQCCLERSTNRLPEPLSDSLEWFAGVVSSMAANLENEVAKILTGAADNDLNEFKSDGRKQTEKMFEDLCYKSNEHKEEGTADDSLSRQQRRGRRVKQQRVVRKKAVHTLGVLSRATRVGSDNVTKRKRNMGENDFVKRRLDSNIAHCSGLEQFTFSPPTWRAKDKHVGRCLIGWGSPKGRRRTRKARSDFLDFPPDFHQLLT